MECTKPENPSEWYAIRAAGVGLKDLYWAIKDLDIGEDDREYLLNRIKQTLEPIEAHTAPDFSKQMLSRLVTDREYTERLTREEKKYLCHFHGTPPGRQKKLDSIIKGQSMLQWEEMFPDDR